jgi:ubiquinone/menaquinone biosynthesis C-methylase UbiE
VPEPVNLFNDGKAYERLMGRWSKVAGDKFLGWLDAPKNLRWIDVGCGNGAFTEVLIERSSPATVTGIDPSDGQLAYARRRPGTKMAQFRIGDAQSLPFPERSFDAASMALVISFVPDAVKAAKEMTRVVKPGGPVGTYMWDFIGRKTPLEPITVAMESLGMTLPSRPNVDASRREKMREIWQQAGLQAIDTNVIRISIVYSDFEDFWQSTSAPVGPSGKAISEMSPGMRDRLKARLREQVPVAADGRIAYEAVANAVKGRVRA